ncbi:MAG: Gfo/Idh/MocA family oxidoreductase [Boseongicola sp. SB0677_bin_26]|nr:Gfo/Idh/MocA family oxidoreductase [Boseongicola sp. SB0665_bin_10]MYG28539.1 Gfo/Idh/MocA family oxidoreductase [Boseongicola sp. SB0677_bin_26]
MALKTALVGIGKIARDQHIPAIEANPEFELVATASRNADVEGIPAFRNLASLLGSISKVDCVSLCTPPAARHSDARLAVEAGSHVMLEKPPGTTLADVQELASLADKSGVTLFASWHSREAASVRATRDWLQGRTVREVRIDWKEDVRFWHPGQDWIWQADGFGVFDPGINALSILTAIHPRTLVVSEASLSIPENRDAPVAAQMLLHDSEGTKVSVELDWLNKGSPKWDIRILADDGEALLRDGGARLLVDGEETVSGPDREYQALYERLAGLIASGSSDVDLAPMRIVSDVMAVAHREVAPPFAW